LSRVVLETHDDLSEFGRYLFHMQDREHTELLKGRGPMAQKIVDTIQSDLDRQKGFKLATMDIPTPFILWPQNKKEWSTYVPKNRNQAKYLAPIQNAKHYFSGLTADAQDVGQLFYYDAPSQLLILLHPVSSQKLYSQENRETMNPPRPIEAVMGLVITKKVFQTDYFNILIRRTKVTRFVTNPVNTILTNADYHFQVLDERGQVIFTDTRQWSSLASQTNYIQTKLKIEEPEKFLTGWTFEVLTKSNLTQITAYGFWQMFWASALVALMLCALFVITLKAGMVAVKVSDMKSDIVAGVSHDLKTPLAGIIASAQLLASGRVSTAEETKQFSGYIVTEAKRLTDVVEKVLTLAKLESHQITMKPIPFAVTDLVDHAIKSISCAFPQAIILKGGIPQGEISGDFQALTTVLVNLMDNAIRYSKDEPWVKVQAFWSQHGEKCTLHLQVEDRGVGIPHDEQPFIFQKFYRVRNGLVTDTDGTGLGLAIASQIVQAHRGHIQVESEEGVGSKFIVRLPNERSHSSH